MKKFILVLIAFLLVGTLSVQAKAQQNNQAVENTPDEINQLAEIRTIVQQWDIKKNINRNLALLSITIKYHNGEITLKDDELLNIKQDCIQQIGDIFEQIDFLICRFGYPTEAFKRAEAIVPKQLLDYTKTVVDISQLNLTTDEKVDLLFKTLDGGSGCGTVIEYFLYSFAAGVGGILYGLMNALFMAAIPGLGIILFIFPGIPIYAIGILGIVLFLTILSLTPVLLILCLLGAI
jgi:hypothetical protein